ncbi:hypothetical protein [Caulobacter sp. RHG1]|uniref:hypothetical protein n=1 Tax=Caulobacter sp. (strain RHG1) TaxID=2545762 RepID=UPI00155755B1|nr:hypothetical protein [Caulobacter sp. RHG1]NQE61351.1 hypothetical protein [Caulobacter sp. RHG1]
MSVPRSVLAATVSSLLAASGAGAQAIDAPTQAAVAAPFDIVRTEVVSNGAEVAFRVQVRGKAGDLKPKATGQFAGSAVYSYVWPTSLDSSTVGFDKAQGIVALAVTFHPDFDDGAAGAVNRHVWHPHWVVLTKDAVCGPAALKVKDIPPGAKPKLPATWPGVPLLIDSPTYPTTLATDTVEVRVPVSAVGALEGVKFDGVTSALKVNANLHAPLLCVSDVFDVASGDLSLPGKVAPVHGH